MAKLIIARALTAFIIQSDTIPNVVSVEWADDGKTLFYTVPDHLKRPYKVRARTSLAAQKLNSLGSTRLSPPIILNSSFPTNQNSSTGTSSEHLPIRMSYSMRNTTTPSFCTLTGPKTR